MVIDEADGPDRFVVGKEERSRLASALLRLVFDQHHTRCSRAAEDQTLLRNPETRNRSGCRSILGGFVPSQTPRLLQSRLVDEAQI